MVYSGDGRGKNVIILMIWIDTAGTLCKAAGYRENGAKSVRDCYNTWYLLWCCVSIETLLVC
jgi:phosphoribosylpyrophosphate synthetase